MNRPNPVKSFLKSIACFIGYDSLAMESYSQEGEDRILARLFDQKTGFYVDVGAHHPKRFSNTFIFYKRGWHGINIDAMPGSMSAFRRVRPRDTNLEIPIADSRKTLTYFQFDEPALNGFCQELATSRPESYKIIAKRDMEAYPLGEILEKHIKEGQVIDFMSVDVEGLDLAVLQSNNWLKFRPRVILVENREYLLQSLQQDPLHQFLESHRYCLYGKSVKTYIYMSSDHFEKRKAQ